ncbi:MAG: pilus assembly PilX N-terminal domain-containing protein, partial [Armatimonadetes bacterium]|nr:pilus assembly PilX N-terminal domain-containing protein [Armatimonadota bacterium]
MRNFHKRGVTSVMVLLMMFVALTVMLSLASSSMGSLKRASNERDTGLAYNVAQAALEYQLAQSMEAMKNSDDDFIAQDYSQSDLAHSLTPGATATVDIQPTGVPYRAWFTSYATYKGKTASVRVLVKAKDYSIWNNAIFAGTGSSGKTINGGVDVRGSVHLLGEGESNYTDLNGNGKYDDDESFTDVGNGVWDVGEKYDDLNSNGVYDAGEPFTDIGNGVYDLGEPWIDADFDGFWNPAEPFVDENYNGKYDKPLTSTDISTALSGGAYVGNNYYDMPTWMRDSLLPLKVINGEETLEAEFRVKRGMVDISGSASIGSEKILGSGDHKANMDGVFTADGFIGQTGADAVFSDNGAYNDYDLGHVGFKFPYISGPSAEEYTDESGVAWATQELYLDSNSLTIPINEFNLDTPAFNYSDLAGNSISWTPAVTSKGGKILVSPKLNIEGLIKIDGSLSFDNDLEWLLYSGSGSFYVTQDINVGTNLVPDDGLVFPTDTTFGLIAKRDINLATNGEAQLAMIGAFFAQGTIKSAKQNVIAGTFVSNFFDMGLNVPSVFQVPSLSKNL